MKVHELPDALAELSGWPAADARHRARLLREARRLPKGRPGPRGGVDATPEHAAMLIAAMLAGGSAIEAMVELDHLEQTRAGAVDLNCSRELLASCARQVAIDIAVDSAALADGNVQHIRAVDFAAELLEAEGWRELLPAGSFVDTIAHLIRAAGDPDSAVPWLAVRRVGVTRAGDARVGWVEFPAAVTLEQLRFDAAVVGGFRQQTFNFDDGRRIVTGSRLPYVLPSELGRYLLGRSLEREVRLDIKVLFEIGKALAVELSATKTNGSPKDEPLEVLRTAVGAAGTSMIVRAEDTRESVSDARLTLRSASSSTGQPGRETRSNGQPRGGGAERRRNAAQAQ